MVGMVPIANDGSALLGAAHWIEGLIQSPVTIAIAVLAVAATGLSMLTGRLPVRRGLAVTLGCFILFGAPAIARGIVASVGTAVSDEPAAIGPAAELPTPVFNPPPKPAQPAVEDPYAGASVTR